MCINFPRYFLLVQSINTNLKNVSLHSCNKKKMDNQNIYANELYILNKYPHIDPIPMILLCVPCLIKGSFS